MNWRDFAALAARLAGGAAEAEWRTAVSRAYYAAFHAARDLLAGMGFTVPRADRAHQYLVFRLSNSGESAVERAGRDLDTLRRLRNRADYDQAPAVTRQQAAAAVVLAEGILQALDGAGQEPARSRVQGGMAAYERDVLHDVTWQP